MSENIVNGEDRALNILADYFQKTFNLGVGNDYDERILKQRMEELSGQVKDAYPEYFEAFESARQKFMGLLKQRYSSSRNQQQPDGSGKESVSQVEEKKTELKATTATTATQSWANV